MAEPRLMTPEQMINVWCLMTGASVTDTQKEALINLLEECYKAGVRKSRAMTEQECYDSVSVTGSGRQVEDELAVTHCERCGDTNGHYHWCELYDSQA